MNLLVLSPWFPCPPDNGSRQRAFHLLRAWKRAGHGVHLVAGRRQADEAVGTPGDCLAQLCDSVNVVPWRWHDGTQPGRLSTLLSFAPRSIVETNNEPFRAAAREGIRCVPDAVIAFELAAAPFVPRNTGGAPVILDQVEVSGVVRAGDRANTVAARLRAILTRAKHDAYWRRELRRFDAITAVSEKEANAVRGVLGGDLPPVFIVPNGADVEAFPLRDTDPVSGRMIYNGSPAYGPNREAVSWFVREILPGIVRSVPDAHLVVTGNVPAEVLARYSGDRGRVRFTGSVPDIRPELAASVVCPVPLRVGGGTRVKILEAWAAGVPVVSTSVGIEGVAGWEREREILIADSASQFSAACVRLLTDPALAGQTAANARRLAEAQYDWRGIAGRIPEIVQTLRS